LAKGLTSGSNGFANLSRLLYQKPRQVCDPLCQALRLHENRTLRSECTMDRKNEMPKPKVWEGNSCLAIERHERQLPAFFL
ncbi:hypothetical protein, partial [Proteus mirabilis]